MIFSYHRLSIFLSVVLILVSPTSQSAEQVIYQYPSSLKLGIKTEELGRCFGLLAVKYNKSDLFDKNEMYCMTHLELDQYKNTEVNAIIRDLEKDIYKCNYNKDPMFDYLAAFNTRQYDYLTGEEAILKKWILQQKDNSVNPFNLFEKSMEIHRGNGWNAILAIHQLLRNEFRWDRREYYNYISSVDDENIMANKLIDIRGDLKERGAGFLGDHGGSWYRIWASMLDHLSHSTINESMLYLDQSKVGNINRNVEGKRFTSIVKNNLDSIRNFVIGNGVEFYKTLMPHGKLDKRKAELNVKGGEIAGYMVDQVLSPKNYQSNQLQIEDCSDPGFYLQVIK